MPLSAIWGPPGRVCVCVRVSERGKGVQVKTFRSRHLLNPCTGTCADRQGNSILLPNSALAAILPPRMIALGFAMW